MTGRRNTNSSHVTRAFHRPARPSIPRLRRRELRDRSAVAGRWRHYPCQRACRCHGWSLGGYSSAEPFEPSPHSRRHARQGDPQDSLKKEMNHPLRGACAPAGWRPRRLRDHCFIDCGNVRRRKSAGLGHNRISLNLASCAVIQESALRRNLRSPSGSWQGKQRLPILFWRFVLERLFATVSAVYWRADPFAPSASGTIAEPHLEQQRYP